MKASAVLLLVCQLGVALSMEVVSSPFYRALLPRRNQWSPPRRYGSIPPSNQEPRPVRPPSGGSYQSPGSSTPYSSPNFFPYYLEEIFKLRSFIKTTSNRLTEAEGILGIAAGDGFVDGFVDDFQELLDMLTDDLDGATCGSGFYFEGKCYEIPLNADETAPATDSFADAQQDCLERGGILAIPNMKDESTFGQFISDVFADILTEDDELWLNAVISGTDITFANGLILGTSDPHTPGSLTDTHALALVVKDETDDATVPSDWVTANVDPTMPKGYICEFKYKLIPD